MRFLVALTGLVGMASATAVHGGVKKDFCAKTKGSIKTDVGGVKTGVDVDAKVKGDVNVDVNSGGHSGVGAEVDVGAKVQTGVNAGIDGVFKPDVKAGVETSIVAHAKVAADVDIEAAKKIGSGYKCPSSMSYCPWSKACACAPGKKFDSKKKTCVGTEIVGAWVEVDIEAFANVDVKLANFCAKSPTQIVKYNAKHEYCQASLNTITFTASADIELEVSAGVEIDLDANISAELKNVCGALAGLYLESVTDAVALFNTDVFGLATVGSEVSVDIFGFLGTLKGIGCKLGVGKCHVDCVAHSAKGCRNFIDVGAEVEAGVHIGANLGLCILPKVIVFLNASKALVTVAVDSLLCLVGGIIKTLVSTFDCHCS